MKFVIGLDILQVKKSSITYSINHNFAKIRIDSYNSLRIEKILTFHKVIILSKLMRIKINTITFLEKGSYKDKSSTQYF